MKKGPLKYAYLSLGWLFVALAILGIFLPLLPTTPFILLSAYFFSKSSERLHQWLLQQKTFGPLIRNWHEHGAISLRAKMWSTYLIVPLFAYTIIFVEVLIAIKVLVTLIGCLVLGFIWTRPTYPADSSH